MSLFVKTLSQILTATFDISKLEELERLPRQDPARVIEEGSRFIDDPEVKNDPALTARLEKCIGYSYCFLSDYPNAIKHTLISLEIYTELRDNSNMGNCYNNLGITYFYAGSLDLALHYFNKSLALCQDAGNKYGTGQAQLGIGCVYSEIQQSDKAVDFLNKSIETARELQEVRLEVRGLQSLADVEFRANNYNKCLDYCKQCEDLLDQGSHFDDYWVFLTKGKCYLELKQYEDASNFISRALTIGKELRNEYRELSAKFYLAQAEFYQGKMEHSLQIMEEILGVAESREFLELARDILDFEAKYSEDPIRLVELNKRQLAVQKKIIASVEDKMSEVIRISESVSTFETTELSKQHRELEEAHGTLAALNFLGRQIAAISDIDRLVEVIYENLNQRIAADMLAIGIYDKSTNELVIPQTIEENQKLGKSTLSLSEKDRPAVKCFTEDREFIIDDLDTQSAEYFGNKPEAYIGKQTQSVMYLPLHSADKVIGTVSIQSFKKFAYDEDDVEFVRGLSTYIGVAMENALLLNNLEEQVVERTSELEKQHGLIRKLNEIGRTIIACSSVKEIVDKVYDRINEVMPVNAFGYGIINQNNTAIIKTVREDDMSTEITDYLSEDVYSVRCFNSRQPVVVNQEEWDDEEHAKAQISTKAGRTMRSILYYPLITSGECFGVITVQSDLYAAYSEAHIEIIEVLASYSAIALENIRSYDKLKTLSEIGKEITAAHTIKGVNSIIYQLFGKIIPVQSCGVGLFNKKTNTLEYPAPIEKGQKVSDVSVSLDEDTIDTNVFIRSNEIVIKKKEEAKYHVKFPHKYVIEEGDDASESMIYIPLVEDNKNVGVLYLKSSSKDSYTVQHLNLVKNLTSYIVLAIQNIRSFENLSRLSVVGQEVLMQTTVNGVIDLLHDRLASFLDDTIFYIGLYDKLTDEIRLMRVYENAEITFEDYILKGTTNTSIALYCARTNHTFIGNKFDDLKKFLPNYKHDDERGRPPESIIAVPIVFQDEMLGVISVQSYKENAYSREHLEIMNTIASFVSTTLHNISTTSTLMKLSIVASKTDNAIIIADDSGNIEWVNEAFERISGQTLEQMVSKKQGSLQASSSQDSIEEIVQEVISTKKSVNYESHIIDTDGNKKFVQTTLTPLMDEENKVNKLIAIDSDITFQKKAELEIRAINKDITDSINYARRIQQAMLPTIGYFKELFTDSFVLFKPKDIVSGDFYWIHKNEEGQTVVAAIDCTGHGVPGAFLTIVGTNLLNQIVIHEGITSPGKILEEMNVRLLKRLVSTDENKVRDGMDAAICTLTDKGDEEIEVQFAGAFNPLYYVVDNELNELAANTLAIGTPYEKEPLKYEQETIFLPRNTMLYLFSDGYPDQLGGRKGKKFMKTNFRELLTQISSQPASEQKAKLDEVIENWRGNHFQVDDILIVGFKL